MQETEKPIKSFIFYLSFYEAIKELDKDIQLEVFKAICEYSFYNKLIELSTIAKSIFILMQPNIDKAIRTYQANTENGKKGGAPNGNQNAKKQPKNNPNTTQEQPKNNPNTTQEQPKNNLDKDKDIDIDIDIDIDNNISIKDKSFIDTNKNFIKPTLEEIKSYCQERNNNVDAETFYDYYERKGWLVGKYNSKMISWKASVRTWEKNGEQYGNNKQEPTSIYKQV